MKRYNITVSDDLCVKMDEFIAKNHTNRSNLISIAVSQYIEAMEAMPGLQAQLKELASSLEDLKIK